MVIDKGIKYNHMKKLLLLMLLCPLALRAQSIKERYSRAYIGLMLHDFNELGISLVNSFGINKYLGIGAGADLTRFEGEIMVPVYADLRVKYSVNSFAPFAFGQFGYQLYNGEKYLGVDINANPMQSKMQGKYFYGGGAGIAYKAGKIGFYASYIHRGYYFKYDDMVINGRDFSPKNPESVGVVNLGLIF